MPWYRQQRPALFGAALPATKQALDPAGIMNPGVVMRQDFQRGDIASK